MNRISAFIALLALAALAAAQDAPAPQAPAKEPAASSARLAAVPATGDSPLVAAAKRAKGGKIKPGIVVTNENMKQIKGVGGSVTYSNPGDPNAPAYNAADGQTAGAGRTKEDWQKLMSSAQGAVSNAESRIAALQSEVAKLENDFYAWDDPSYRDGVIKPDLDQAKADLEAAKQALDTAKQRILDLEEEARKAGAAPGWLR